jgi:hypothetical protein
MNRRRIPSAAGAARVVTVAAGLGLLVSLFLTWSSVTLRQLALLAVAASGDLTHFAPSQNAWQASPGMAVALTVVALLVIATGVLNRRPLVLPAGVACLAALVYVIVRLGDPPSAVSGYAGATVSSSGGAAHSSAGAGQPVALVALVIAGLGMWAMLAVAQAERRRRRGARRRRQRPTGSAARSPDAAVALGEPADGSA